MYGSILCVIDATVINVMMLTIILCNRCYFRGYLQWLVIDASSSRHYYGNRCSTVIDANNNQHYYGNRCYTVIDGGCN
jgi:hypothetical protein